MTETAGKPNGAHGVEHQRAFATPSGRHKPKAQRTTAREPRRWSKPGARAHGAETWPSRHPYLTVGLLAMSGFVLAALDSRIFAPRPIPTIDAVLRAIERRIKG